MLICMPRQKYTPNTHPNNAHLHAQADAQEGHLALAGVLDGRDLTLHAPVAEPTRHQHAWGRVLYTINTHGEGGSRTGIINGAEVAAEMVDGTH